MVTESSEGMHHSLPQQGVCLLVVSSFLLLHILSPCLWLDLFTLSSVCQVNQFFVSLASKCFVCSQNDGLKYRLVVNVIIDN